MEIEVRGGELSGRFESQQRLLFGLAMPIAMEHEHEHADIPTSQGFTKRLSGPVTGLCNSFQGALCSKIRSGPDD